MTADDKTGSFQCRRCGTCCQWEGAVRVSEQEINLIAGFLQIEVTEFIRDFTCLTPDRKSLSLLEKEDGSCLYYDDEQKCCRINPVKPKQCRDFPLLWNFPGWETLCRGAEPEKHKR